MESNENAVASIVIITNFHLLHCNDKATTTTLQHIHNHRHHPQPPCFLLSWRSWFARRQHCWTRRKQRTTDTICQPPRTTTWGVNNRVAEHTTSAQPPKSSPHHLHVQIGASSDNRYRSPDHCLVMPASLQLRWVMATAAVELGCILCERERARDDGEEAVCGVLYLIRPIFLLHEDEEVI